MSQQSKGFFNRRFTAQAESSPPFLHDTAGNDFKKLIEKSRNKEIIASSSIGKQQTKQSSLRSTKTTTLKPHGFAVGEPIILPLPPNYKRPTPGVLDKVYDWLFTHEDRYFNNDRSYLSQDIFPENDDRNSIQKKNKPINVG